MITGLSSRFARCAARGFGRWALVAWASGCGCDGSESSNGARDSGSSDSADAGRVQTRSQYDAIAAALHDGPCEAGRRYEQADLLEPVVIRPAAGVIETELVVRIRERCVPVWIPDKTSPRWEMQTLALRTYGFPRTASTTISARDADDPESDEIIWSAPGPTFVMHPASRPGASDGTTFKMRLYNRMPAEPDPEACRVNVKCNTTGPDAGVDPVTGQCRVKPNPDAGGVPPETPSQTLDGSVIEPPNCFHGDNSTNFHFHGFHVSPQAGQDNVLLELRPPANNGAAAPASGHGDHEAQVVYGQTQIALDPLRNTQAPGTHWYHAHKHGSTALQILNGLVGTFKVEGAFDEQLNGYFRTDGGGKLVDRLMVVQQLQAKQPGLGGADQSGAVLVNGQGNPIVRMHPGEIQRWRFVGATMQASAALQIGFPDVPGKPGPEVRQIGMDGVQFSPQNYRCQPFLNNPDCSPAGDDSSFDELTRFHLAPGSRVDLLVKAPDQAGAHCLVLNVTTTLAEANKSREQHAVRAELAEGTCGDTGGLGPLFTLIVEGKATPMMFPEASEDAANDSYPAMPPYLADLPAPQDIAPARQRAVHYQMVNQGQLQGTQFWINQEKYDPSCANETLTLDAPEAWTLWNNSTGVAHPFHMHQNPFQLFSQSDRATAANADGAYEYPVWRDVVPIPKATAADENLSQWPPNSDPADPSGGTDSTGAWGKAVIVYVAKEFTGAFVNHCHILGHEDRGMMHNTQAVCPDERCAGGSCYAVTGPVDDGIECGPDGFCSSDCATGETFAAAAACPAPPAQTSNWPTAYGIDAGVPMP
jgi:FtsP/CotA-like multicopper oxidase with cupredoxin domain